MARGRSLPGPDPETDEARIVARDLDEDAALELPSEERSGFLDQACDGNEEMRLEVELMLASNEEAGSFLNQAAANAAAGLLAEEATSSLIGAQLGRYKILSSIGSGGMGEVFLAQDTLLGRRIALKLLPAEFTANHDRVRRFEQEAKAASALNHPNIITIHDIGRENDIDFIVMEYVTGKTLDRLIPSRGLKLTDVLNYSVPIADALVKAHSAGIIHRDLKPGNVIVSDEGFIKVLDFGLAKALEPGSYNETMSATIMSPVYMTAAEVLLGTAAYMAPEQARGKAADKRTDIWAFGCVLYEMLAGKQVFAGDTVSDHLASILRADPDWTALPPTVPATVLMVLRNCLQKDPRERWHSAADVRIQLKDARSETAIAPASPRRNRIVWVAVAALAIGLVAALAAVGNKPAAQSPLWLAIPPPPYEEDTIIFTAVSGRRRLLLDAQRPCSVQGDGARKRAFAKSSR